MMKKLQFTLGLFFLITFCYAQTEIPISGTTTVGMQVKDGITEENAYNDDFTNYWTGDPDTEEEVSITFDLTCIHELTEIGINFWKADERTTTFSIEVADEASGPFTTVLDNEISAESDVTVESEQMFTLNTSARYVKFIGIGNSSSSSWTSVANVNIYGNLNPDCEGLTSVSNNQLKDQGVTLFPVPVTNGVLNILSTTKALNIIEVFNVTGQRVLTTNGNSAYSKQINLDKLTAGTYFIKIAEIGHGKFILK